MDTRKLRKILDAWAAWVQDGRPLAIHAYPSHSIITQLGHPHHSNPGSRPLWHGRLKSHWLKEVDRALAGLSDERQAILLGMHLPGRGSDRDRAAELGVEKAKVQYTRKLAGRQIGKLYESL